MKALTTGAAGIIGLMADDAGKAARFVICMRQSPTGRPGCGPTRVSVAAEAKLAGEGNDGIPALAMTIARGGACLPAAVPGSAVAGFRKLAEGSAAKAGKGADRCRIC